MTKTPAQLDREVAEALAQRPIPYMKSRCYACSAPAAGVRDQRPEGGSVEAACARHRDPSIKSYAACWCCLGPRPRLDIDGDLATSSVTRKRAADGGALHNSSADRRGADAPGWRDRRRQDAILRAHEQGDGVCRTDYPYGFRERTPMRYGWSRSPEGLAFVSQTLNPKTSRWNSPKASTYVEWAAAMYLDDESHVYWDGVGPYSDDQKIVAFVKRPRRRHARAAEDRSCEAPLPATHDQRRDLHDDQWHRQPLSEADVKRMHGKIATCKPIGTLLGKA